MAMHQAFSWIPSWLTEAPGYPVLAAGNRLWDLWGMDRFRETRFFPKPVEPNPVLEHWSSTFRREDMAPEVVEDSRATIPPLVSKLQKWHGNRRFLTKMVGRPVKIELLAALFPGARFVHITRALKPTTSSLLLVEFYRGGGFEDWPWGTIPPTYLEFYQARGKPVELAAAITLQLNLLELQRQLSAIGPSSWISLPYADFIADPIEGMRRLGDWAHFTVDETFLKRLLRRKLYAGADEKWQKHFSPAQRRNLDDFEAAFMPSS